MDVGFAALTRADGTIEEHAFVVMGGIGLDAAMIANTNPQLKKTVGWVAYVDGAARSLPNAKPFRVMYELTGHRLHSARVQSVLFANCGSLPAGLELIPEASIVDGAIDIVIFQPKGPLGWMLVWRRVAWDNSFLRKFRAGRRVLALRTKDNAVRYARGAASRSARTRRSPCSSTATSSARRSGCAPASHPARSCSRAEGARHRRTLSRRAPGFGLSMSRPHVARAVTG